MRIFDSTIRYGSIVLFIASNWLAGCNTSDQPGPIAENSPNKAQSSNVPGDASKHWLTDMPEQNAHTGFSNFGKHGDVGHSDWKIFVNERFSPHGLGLIPDGTVQYRIAKRFRTFHTKVALNDTAKRGNEVPTQFAVYGDGVLLWKSGPFYKPGKEEECVLNITGVDTLELRTTLDYRQTGMHHHPHAVWLEPYVQEELAAGLEKAPPSRQRPVFEAAAASDRTWLCELSEENVVVGYGKFGKAGDLGYEKERVSIDDHDSPHALSMHVSAAVDYQLDGKYRTFCAAAAIDDSAGQGSQKPVLFRVLGDGIPLWQSRGLHCRGDLERCVVDVTGIKRLQLRIDENDWSDGEWGHGHTIWAEPFVTSQQLPPLPEPLGTNVAVGRPTPPKGEIDLLQLIDTDKHSVIGAWRFDGPNLQMPAESRARLHIPLIPPPDYELTADIEQPEFAKTVVFGLPRKGMQGLACLDFSEIDKWYSTLEAFNGNSSRAGGAYHEGQVLVPGKTQRVVCTVHPESAEVACDGEKILAWHGNADWMPWSDWRVPNPQVLYIGGLGPCTIKTLTLRGLTNSSRRQLENLALPDPLDRCEVFVRAAQTKAVRQHKNLVYLFDAESERSGLADELRKSSAARERLFDEFVVVWLDLANSGPMMAKAVAPDWNQQVVHELKIDEFPTAAVYDERGRRLGMHVFETDVDKFVDKLCEAKAFRKRRDELLAAEAAAVGEAKLKPVGELVQLLIDRNLCTSYDPEIDRWIPEVNQYDPENKAGVSEIILEAITCFPAIKREIFFEMDRDSLRNRRDSMRDKIDTVDNWLKSRKFQDANRGARIELQTAVLAVMLDDREAAARHADAGLALQPTDKKLLTELKQANHALHFLGSGSGFIVAADGYILTNNHVADHKGALTVVLPGQEKPITAKIIAQDSDRDMALIKIDLPAGYDWRPLTVAGGKLPRGDRVGAFGFPLGEEIGSGVKLTTGIVSATQDQSSEHMVLLDCRVNPGNSGGPLCDVQGRVVGMITAKSISGFGVESYGMAIPGSDLQDFLKKYLPNYTPPGDGDAGAAHEWSDVDKNVSPSVLMLQIGR